ncbi:MAG TPA: hypothetical protein VGI16_16005 [Candidatus Acidoferrum sp.]|jgi:uncharacterized membrane protein
MPFCTTCGTEVNQAAFCPKCGAPQAATTSPSPAASAVPPAGTYALTENVAAALSYSLGWITGIIFLIVDKRPYVKFHALQSIVVFGALNIIRAMLVFLWGASFISGGGFHALGGGILFLHLINLLTFILWILLMVKAYQGDRFEVPVASEVVDSLIRK